MNMSSETLLRIKVHLSTLPVGHTHEVRVAFFILDKRWLYIKSCANNFLALCVIGHRFFIQSELGHSETPVKAAEKRETPRRIKSLLMS